MKKVISILASFILSLSLTLPYTVFAASDCTGGTITYSGGNTIHTFTSSGTLDCTVAGSGTAQALVVGGGGGGGTRTGGGGGAGGFLYDNAYAITATTYTVTVGNGGNGQTGTKGDNGQNSLFDTMTAIGGGGGADNSTAGGNGGSGGGGSVANSPGSGTGGQGNAGAADGGAPDYPAGGGGGSSAAGGAGSGSQAGNGGAGTSSSITGSAVVYAGGGGGGVFSGTAGNGGSGGGANGSNSGLGGNATANTGGGGGGNGANYNSGSPGAGGNGGSGVVIVSYTTGGLTPATPSVVGSGTVNRLAKFTATSTISNALFSDDGSNTTLTSGNLFLPVSSILDSITNGALNFGTTLATTMTFGRSGQNMVINSKVGIGTTTPAANLHVIGDIFANFINILADGLGLDTYTAGTLSLGSTTATSIKIGRLGITTTMPGVLSYGSLSTVSNCSSTTTPSTCGSAPSGSVAMPTGGDTIVVNTTAVTANSQIMVTEDSSLGSRLGITCNTAVGRRYTISARTAGTSFTIRANANPATNKACLSYFIVN